MKHYLAICGLALTLNSYSQSYLILNNGVTLTTDNSSYIYDFGHFIAPYKVTLTGGQFLAEEEKLISIDTSGFLYRKEEKAPKKLKGKGINYLISDSGALITFDKSGYFYKFDKDSAFKKAVAFGGNFFTVKPDDKKPQIDLYTINNLGNYFKINVAGLNPAEIATLGGNFFRTTSGVVHTVTAAGLVYAKPEIKTSAIKKSGGNYFITQDSKIFTVSEDGFLFLPVLPANLKIDLITKMGTNYFIDQEGRYFSIDKAGVISERTIKDHDLRNAKVLSL